MAQSARDGAIAVLGVRDLSGLLERTPPLDHTTTLAEAAAWLAGRDPGEAATRQTAPLLSPAPG